MKAGDKVTSVTIGEKEILIRGTRTDPVTKESYPINFLSLQFTYDEDWNYVFKCTEELVQDMRDLILAK
jgi:hypothetical protein